MRMPISRLLGWTALVLSLLVAGAVTVIAIGLPIGNSSFGTGSGSTQPCDTDGVTVDIPDPMAFDVRSGQGVDVIELDLSGVNAACDNKRFAAAIGRTSNGDCIAQADGVLTVNSGNASIQLGSAGCTLPTAANGDTFSGATSGVGQVTVTFYE